MNLGLESYYEQFDAGVVTSENSKAFSSAGAYLSPLVPERVTITSGLSVSSLTSPCAVRTRDVNRTNGRTAIRKEVLFFGSSRLRVHGEWRHGPTLPLSACDGRASGKLSLEWDNTQPRSGESLSGGRSCSRKLPCIKASKRHVRIVQTRKPSRDPRLQWGEEFAGCRLVFQPVTSFRQRITNREQASLEHEKAIEREQADKASLEWAQYFLYCLEGVSAWWPRTHNEEFANQALSACS